MYPIESIEYIVKMDGNAWCCHGVDFIDLQSSYATFGETESEAVLSYLTYAVNMRYS